MSPTSFSAAEATPAELDNIHLTYPDHPAPVHTLRDINLRSSRTEYEGSTLREKLGLARPQNQHAARRGERKAA